MLQPPTAPRPPPSPLAPQLPLEAENEANCVDSSREESAEADCCGRGFLDLTLSTAASTGTPGSGRWSSPTIFGAGIETEDDEASSPELARTRQRSRSAAALSSSKLEATEFSVRDPEEGVDEAIPVSGDSGQTVTSGRRRLSLSGLRPAATHEDSEQRPSFRGTVGTLLSGIRVSTTLPSMPDITDSKDHMSFLGFTVLLGCLMFFTILVNGMLMAVVTEAEVSAGSFRESIAFSGLVWFLQVMWMAVVLVTFVDILSSYVLLLWGRTCPNCSARCWQRCGAPLKEERTYIGNSDLRRPYFWRFFDAVLGVELTPRRYLLVLSLLLPVNVLLFYRNIGSPAYTRPFLGDVPGVAELASAEWLPTGNVVRAGGLKVDILTWFITAEDGSINPSLNITSKECYHPQDYENKLLAKLQAIEAPKQAHCESVLGTLLVRRLGWDDDMWEESYSFTVRLFGAFAGVIADQMLGSEGSGFLEDMTDIFDMYLISFADVVQMHEGRPLLGSMSNMPTSYHDFVPVFLVTGYIAMVLRALAMFGCTPIAWLLIRAGHPAGKAGDEGLARLQRSIGAATSLLFIEVPFLSLRAMALLKYQVPVSVLAVKNVLHAYRELRIMHVLKGFGEELHHDKVRAEAAKIWWRCRKRLSSNRKEPEERQELARCRTPGSSPPTVADEFAVLPPAGPERREGTWPAYDEPSSRGRGDSNPGSTNL